VDECKPLALGGLVALTRLRLRSGNSLTSVPGAWKKGGALERSGCNID
jgi:hypothetical protein